MRATEHKKDENLLNYRKILQLTKSYFRNRIHALIIS